MKKACPFFAVSLGEYLLDEFVVCRSSKPVICGMVSKSIVDISMACPAKAGIGG